MIKRALLCVSLVAACGGGDDDGTIDPTDVPFGTTAIVVVVNPLINDGNSAGGIAEPGAIVADVTLTTDDGVTATTGADGIAVLAPVTAGTRTITVSGAVDGGTFTVTVADGTLREVALATEAGRAELMVSIDYKSDQAFEVTPTMSIDEVNGVLAVSDRVVFFRGGNYTGDLDFSGSRVTLFGEGVLGGAVVLDGNMTVSGSDSRIRGAHITGSLTMPASKIGLAFSRVDGAVTSEGSDVMMVANALCGAESVTGSGTVMIGNHGAAPITGCP
ncbi:MAG: hypothetical protein F9K40_21245 [Kofleriaceae bacterium]|nr:MAG: hypothetical protein F9K40_21245 [Kofleriaceae bacterium]MBZ0234963.1 hypothetical protein [Kofleriaceae bacterium]